MDRIIIKDLEIFAKHGLYPEENALGQKFLFSVTLYLDTVKAGLSEDLKESVNYGELCHFIKKFNEEHTFKLLESAAENLAREILYAFPLVKKLDLEIKKPWAPIGLPLDTVSVLISRGWHTAYIALGSNIGDSKGYLDFAVKRLGDFKDSRVIKVADYLVTKPYGGVEQDDFLNSALELKTLLSPEELLDRLHVIEQEANRERIIHWGPRTLDLDILLYDDLIYESDDLQIPHIEIQLRDFVLKPMAQIAPARRHPVFGKTMAQLLKDLG